MQLHLVQKIDRVMATSITANKPIPAPESVPLLVEPVELEEAPPTCPADEFLRGNYPICCLEVNNRYCK